MSGHSVFVHPVFGARRGDGPARKGAVPLSMIDVVFLLLIFLLLGQFPLAEGLLSMPLSGRAAPDASSAAARQPAHTLWVQVRPGREGRLTYRLNDWPDSQSADELIGHLGDWVRRAGAEELRVVVSAEPGVPFEEVVALWEACRGMGVRQLALPAGSAGP